MADVWVVTHYDGEDTDVESVWDSREAAVSHVGRVAPEYRMLDPRKGDRLVWVHPRWRYDTWDAIRMEVCHG